MTPSRISNRFSGVSIVGTTQQYAGLIEASRREAMPFFGAARVAEDPELMRFGQLQRIFREFSPSSSQGRYRVWSQQHYQDAYHAGINGEAVSANKLMSLAAHADPALFVILQLESLRRELYTDICHEQRLIAGSSWLQRGQTTPDRLLGIITTYEHFLSSVHAPGEVQVDTQRMGGNAA